MSSTCPDHCIITLETRQTVDVFIGSIGAYASKAYRTAYQQNQARKQSPMEIRHTASSPRSSRLQSSQIRKRQWFKKAPQREALSAKIVGMPGRAAPLRARAGAWNIPFRTGSMLSITCISIGLPVASALNVVFIDVKVNIFFRDLFRSSFS
jgi:hypothetical protein